MSPHVHALSHSPPRLLPLVATPMNTLSLSYLQAAVTPGPNVHYHLLTDSFSALTFGHNGSHQFFSSILKVDVTTLPVLYDANFASFYLPPPHPNSSSPRTLLDFYTPPIRRGSVVPQGLWLPRSATDRQRHVRDAPLQYPIWLHRSDGSLGVPMLHAASGNLSSLIRSQETINIGMRSTIHLRIMWPGYLPQNYQIQLRDQTQTHSFITTERFVASVGRALNRFFDTCTQTTPVLYLHWRIGSQGGITKNEVIIVGLFHVSAGSFQLCLQLENRIVPG